MLDSYELTVDTSLFDIKKNLRKKSNTQTILV